MELQFSYEQQGFDTEISQCGGTRYIKVTPLFFVMESFILLLLCGNLSWRKAENRLDLIRAMKIKVVDWCQQKQRVGEHPERF